MRQTFRIIRGGPDAAGTMATLHASAFPDAWPEAAIAALLARDGVFALLAVGDADDALLGFIMMQVVVDDAEVLTFCVSQDARQSGLGGGLLAAACDLARTDGAHQIFLEVGERNEVARKLYERDGFSVVGRRSAYYRHGAESGDALVMRKPLNQP